jgi:hypothetical protein
MITDNWPFKCSCCGHDVPDKYITPYVCYNCYAFGHKHELVKGVDDVKRSERTDV